MEVTSLSSVNTKAFDEDLYEEIEEDSKKLEEYPAFIFDLIRLKTIEVTLKILKQIATRIVNKIFYPYQ